MENSMPSDGTNPESFHFTEETAVSDCKKDANLEVIEIISRGRILREFGAHQD